MEISTVWKALASVLSAVAAFSCVTSLAQNPAQTPGVEAVTRPSADVTVSFIQPGQVEEIGVKVGDVVKAGQVLARLDDKAERLKLAQMKAEADDTLRIRAAEAQLAQKKSDAAKLEWAAKEGAATQWEVEHAKLEVVIGDMSMELAKFNKDQAQRAYEEMLARVERMKITSPVDGVVEWLYVEEGEGVEALAEAIRIVKTDVLWADVPSPLSRAMGLKVGQAVDVGFPAPAAARLQGKVIHTAAVADPASETIRVRLEIPNPAGRPAGERVRAYFP